ncbi:MAG: hypothetical protein MGF17_10610 [Trichodesmium sp. MAG_R04]|nr:hypothetical protein [Trichodesmium sp. MAG_R04]
MKIIPLVWALWYSVVQFIGCWGRSQMCIRTVGMAILYITATSFWPSSVVVRLGRFRLCLVIVGGFGDSLGIV